MITLLVAFVALAGNMADRIGAVVDEEPITISEVYELGNDFITERCKATPTPSCFKEGEAQVLEELIKRALMRKELDKLGMKVGPAEVDQAIDSIVRDNEFEDRQQFRQEVERSGMKWEVYREQLLEQVQTQRFQQAVIVPRLSVSEDEVQDRYRRSLASVAEEPEVDIEAFGKPMPAGADFIARDAIMQQLSDLVGEINAGKLVWAEVVAKNDEAGLAKALGGRSYRKGKLSPAIEPVLFEMAVGQVSPPILIRETMFVVKVVERRMVASNVKAFDEVKDKIREALFDEKAKDAEAEWYTRARRESSVVVLGQ